MSGCNPDLQRQATDMAVALFRQLQRETRSAEIDAAAVGRHERLLRLHLHVLGRCPLPELPATGEAEVFVGLASRLSSPAAGIRTEGYRLAYELLAGDGAPVEGAFAALSRFPEHDFFSPLDLYRSHPALRPLLFRLWREQGREVSAALLSQAELQGDESLQLAALEYAADRPAVGIELFRAYYQPLGSAGSPLSGKLLAAALWGGMQRGERETARLLRRGIEAEADPQTRLKLLRLGALSADADLLPVLRQLLQERPVHGARLLALQGSREAVDLLVEALDSAAALEAVALSWRRVSGSGLPQTARLRLVGGEDSPGQGSMPEAAAARVWWQKRRPGLKTGERLVYGDPLTRPRLLQLASSLAGEAGRDLLDQLALQLGRPLGISARSEQLIRQRVLRRLQAAGNGR